MASIALGAALAIGAALLYDGGVALQSLEARATPKHWAWRATLVARLLRRPRWILGTLLGLLGWPLHAAAMLFAPLTVVQPALAVGLVLLLVVGARLGERVGSRDVAAVAGIMLGVGVLAAVAPAARLSDGRALGVAVAFGAVGATALGAALVARRHPRDVRMSAAVGGLCFAASGLSTELAAAAWHGGHAAALVLWVVASATTGLLGLVAEMTALQRAGAARVAPVELAVQIVVPVLLAPAIGAGAIARGTAGVGVALLAAALVTTCAITLLGGSDAIGAVLEDPPRARPAS